MFIKNNFVFASDPTRQEGFTNSTNGLPWLSRWWFQLSFIFIPTYIFQTSWNHQRAVHVQSKCNFCSASSGILPPAVSTTEPCNSQWRWSKAQRGEHFEWMSCCWGIWFAKKIPTESTWINLKHAPEPFMNHPCFEGNPCIFGLLASWGYGTPGVFWNVLRYFR